MMRPVVLFRHALASDTVCVLSHLHCLSQPHACSGPAALATEPPRPELLLEKPHGRHEALISPRMWKHIITQALYQLLFLFLVVYGAPRHLPAYSVRSPRIALLVCS